MSSLLDSTRRRIGQIVGAGESLAIAGLGISFAAFAFWGAAFETPPPGVSIMPDGSGVTLVSPGGAGWRSGIRPGMKIVSVRAADEPGGWELAVSDGDLLRVVDGRSARDDLGGTLPSALVGLLAGLIGLARSRRSDVALGGLVALGFATIPLTLLRNPALQVVSGTTAVVAPALYLLRRVQLPLALGILLGATTFASSWAAATLTGAVVFDVLDPARIAATAVLITASFAARPWLRAWHAWLGSLRPIDGAALAFLVISWLAFGVADFSVEARLVLVAVAVFLYPKARRRVLSELDRALVGELRERVRIEVEEGERARLARELHDVPLQQLAGVIRRLEVEDAGHGAGEALRGVAAHLRTIATDLHPPVLDDFGLGAALRFVAETTLASDPRCPPITLDLVDETGLERAERPPGDVELASYRIVQEAITNAISHADATSIRVDGRLTPTTVILEVRDNGKGMDEAVLDAAARTGRMGLASMRRRAEAVGASIDIRTAPDGGGLVRLAWGRRG